MTEIEVTIKFLNCDDSEKATIMVSKEMSEEDKRLAAFEMAQEMIFDRVTWDWKEVTNEKE